MQKKQEKLITTIAIVLLILALILLGIVISMLLPSKIKIDTIKFEPNSKTTFYTSEKIILIENAKYLSDSKYERVKNLLGENVDKYHIYITNKESSVKYFQLKLTFTDKEGNEHSYFYHSYIYPEEEKEFTYVDVTTNKNKYYSFDYQIKVI